MPSFDIISEVDNVEIKNAVDNSIRELDTRFDFRGVESSIELNKETVKIKSESEFQIDQIVAILRKTASQDIEFKQGIDQATAKKLVKSFNPR